jgi:formylglycine-generating enzyme required for sulfatase activity
MGSEKGSGNQRPVHEVRVSPFQMLATTVTNRQYRPFASGRGKDDQLPVVSIDWYHAYAYAAWLGGRLPTEAEWEYACRAGTTTRYWSGDEEADLARVGWYSGNSGNRLHLVGEKDANRWGLYDMHGNVWEWVADWSGPYPEEPQTNPWGPASGVRRVLRGGSFGVVAVLARSAYRLRRSPWDSWLLQGFRVVVPVAPSDRS